MAEPATQLKPQVTNVITISGKITRFRIHDGVRYYEVTLPAVDEYSTPQRVLVESRNTLGNIGEPLIVHCTVKGYTREFTTRDGERGWSTQMAFVDKS
jgi:ribulose 1,5-bisphosphate carboxylase large subunit-like protein